MLLSFLKKISFLIGLSHEVQAGYFYEKRKDLQDKIYKETLSKRIINIYGLSGMGKSVLAKMFMQRLEKNAQAVLWFDWDRASINEQVENAQKKLKQKRFFGLKNIFVFIDNYNNKSTLRMEKDFEKLLAMKNTKFILTNNQKIKSVSNIYISSFTQKEPFSLMRRYFYKTKKEKLDRLTASLGYYPYVITTLCRFVRESMTYNIERVEEMIEKDPAVIIKKNIFSCEETGHRAVRKMIENIKKTEPEVYDVLCFLCFLSPRAIPLKLIHFYVGSEDKADLVLEKIDRNAFIALANKDADFIAYDIHEITQKILKEMIDEKDKESVLKKGVRAFVGVFKQDFLKISDANREDQIFYNHLRCFLDMFKNEEKTLPLHVLFLKRPLYSIRDSDKTALPSSQLIESRNPEKNIQDPDILFECLIDLGFCHCFYYGGDQDHFKKGVDLLKKAVHLAESQQNIHQIFKANTRLMWVQIYEGNLEAGKKPLKTASVLLPKIEDLYLKKEYFYGASWHLLERGEFRESYTLAVQGMAFEDVSKNSNMGLYLHLYKAICEYRLGLYNDSLQTLEKALKKESLRFNGAPAFIRAELLQTKSMVKRDQGDLKTAKDLVLQSLVLFQKLLVCSPYPSWAMSLKILGDVFLKERDFKEAKKFLNQSFKMYRSLIKQGYWTYDFAELLVLMGELFLHKKDFDSFKTVYQNLQKCPFKNLQLQLKKVTRDMGMEWLVMF